MSVAKLKPPFPYFGGKARISDLVWERFGNPRNYCEPFAGSLAMLLRRPVIGDVETVNDASHFIVNFWRAVKHDPEKVAIYADAPVHEAELHARHRWLMRSKTALAFRRRMVNNPDAYDPKVAGYWCWGQCAWIGGGWCTSQSQTNGGDTKLQMPDVSRAFGKGCLSSQVPDLAGDSGATGRGVCASAGHKKRVPLDTDRQERGVLSLGRPQLGDAFDIGRGVNSNRHAGTCRERLDWLIDWMQRLADRLRLVRVCYGHWDRICDSNTTMTRLGDTAVFLDPPYSHDTDRCNAWIRHLLGEGEKPEPLTKVTNRATVLYHGDDSNDIDKLVAEVHVWCRRWSAQEGVKIALCGYQGEHDALEALGWDCVPWKTQGGYANRNAANQNKHRERIWFSPSCNATVQTPDLFGDLF